MTTFENINPKAEYNGKADPESSLFFRLVSEIPVFGETTPDIQERLDGLLSALDSNDIQTALTFGDFVQQKRNAVVNGLEEEADAQNLGFIRQPLETALETIKQIDAEGLGAKLDHMMNKGAAVVKRNPGLVAASIAFAFIASPLALLGGAGAIAVKEKARTIRQKVKPDTTDTLEILEHQLRDGILKFKPMIRGLEEAHQKIPGMRESLQLLGRSNQQVIVDVTLCIAAGREKLERITQEELPACADNKFQTQSLENYRLTLAQNVAILEDVRTKSIIDVTLLASSMQTVNNNDMTLRSILGSEILQHRATLVAQAKVADNLRLSRTIEDFRKVTEGTTKTAIKATEAARRASLSSQVDSPERLQAALENLNDVKKVIEKGLADMPKIENARQTLKSQIAVTASEIVGTQLRSVNDNLLGHTQQAAITMDHKL